MKLNKKKKGFTLIELMAVIAIVAILAAVLVPTVNGYITRAKKTAIITQVRTAVNAIESYNATTSVPVSDATTVKQLVSRDGATEPTGAEATPQTVAKKGTLVNHELLKATDVDKIADGITVGQLKIINNDKEEALNKMLTAKDGADKGKFQYPLGTSDAMVTIGQ